MHVTTIYILLSLVININGRSIPFIQNAFFKPFFDTNINISIRLNTTCQECLCDFLNSENNNSYIALNCFPNKTCQFLQTFSVTYRVQPLVEAELYFLQGIFPNSSKCCMPDINELLTRLQNSTPIIANLTYMPSAFGYDANKPNETAIIGRFGGFVYWFNSFNLTFIRNIWIQNASLSLALHNTSIFTAADLIPIVNVFDSQTGISIVNINHGTFSKVRKYIFVNNDQNMIVTAQNNQSLAIFNVNSPTNYTFQQSIPFPFPGVHGLAKVNDTFLYASSWNNRIIVSYNYQNLTWNYKTFVNVTGAGMGSHLTVDDCGRVWFIISTFGLRIYDELGVEIGNWNMSSSSRTIFDILFHDNYVLLITRKEDQQIVRYDPQVSCS